MKHTVLSQCHPHALIRASEGLALGSEGFVVTQAAISSRDGTTFFPNPREGVENLSLANCDVQSRIAWKSLCNYWVELHVTNNQGPINVLSIDVEGCDFDVTFGAGSVLDRTEYLEFEYHKRGTWGEYHITDAVRLLDGKGFTCYWAGLNMLWRITDCYRAL